MLNQQSFTACAHSSYNCMRSCAQSSLSFKQGLLFGNVRERPSFKAP